MRTSDRRASPDCLQERVEPLAATPAHRARRAADPLPIVLSCDQRFRRKAAYVFDTLLMAAGIPAIYVAEPPSCGPWLSYGPPPDAPEPRTRCLVFGHSPVSWDYLSRSHDPSAASLAEGLTAIFPHRAPHATAAEDIAFDLIANAFYFLSSWSERLTRPDGNSRRLYADSVFARLAVPQDIVDQYLQRLVERVNGLCGRLGHPGWSVPRWPQGFDYAVVLSHDVDFLPARWWDNVVQGGKSVLRPLVRQRSPGEAARTAIGLARAAWRRRDPYGCIPEILRKEQRLGVRASFQVATARRHPRDVNYRIEDEGVCRYLRAIIDAGFDLCLHGSYRSTENPDWYAEETALLTERLCRPLGSRQHFLSFDYSVLFAAQERTGIQYDMSIGYPDRTGPRAGFSYPYFPYCLDEDRPYDVLEIGLALMDVTLHSYMGLDWSRAWPVIETALADLRRKRGCISVVWHPVVFGGARDPGYDRLFWTLVQDVTSTGGLATDGRTVNAHWRERAAAYASFSEDGRRRTGVAGV